MAEDAAKGNKNGTDVPKIAEPSEIDPCIESTSSRRNIFRDVERSLREKSGLSRVAFYCFVVLLLLAIALFIAVVSLACTWPTIPHHQQFPICEHPACLRVASQVREAMNSSFSPCEDVWGWACGGWLSRNPLPPDRSVWSLQQQAEVQGAEQIRDLIATLPLPLHTGTVEWKLKYFYEVCMDVDNVNLDQARPLTSIISELGGWYILRNWNEADFSPLMVIMQLHVKYGVSPYFKVSVEPNPRSPGSNSITISPSGLGLPDRSYYYTSQNDPVQIAYKQLIRDVVIHLSVTKTGAEKFGEDMFYYEKRIAEITPHSYEMLNPINTYNPIKLSELKITVANLPLQDILVAMFPEFRITEETEVIVTSPDYLTKVSQIAATTDRATLNSYVMWTLVRKYLPYLSDQFTKTLDSFRSELIGIQRPLSRWEKCSRLVKKFMGLAVESRFEMKEPIRETTKRAVQTVFEEIKKAVNGSLQKVHSSAVLNKYLLNKLSKLKLQIGLPDIIWQENYIKNYYNSLRVFKTNLFESCKNGLNFQRKNEQRLLVSPRPEDILIAFATGSSPLISYSAALNTIIITQGALSHFMYEDEYPSSIIYGRLGISIAEAMVSSVLPFDSAWNADLKLLSPFHSTVNESYKVFDGIRRCLSNYSTIHKLVQENVPDLSSLSMLKHLSAVNLAHKALNSFLEGRPHVHQPTLNKYEDSPLFFLAYAQGHCSRITKQQELFNNLVKYKPSQKSLLQLAWSQIPAFSSSLECCDDCDDICRDIL